jgi:hypothetical protein
MASFQDRAIGAVRGQASTFAEVRNDPTAMNQAALIVLASGIARAASLVLSPFVLFGPVVAIGAVVTAVLGWAVGSFVLWAVGTKVIPGRITSVDVPTVLRTTGFAYVPMVAMALAFVPVLGSLIGLAAGLWCLYLIVLATREIFDYPDLVKAAIAVIAAAIVTAVAIMILSFVFAMLSLPGLFMLGRS